ncbi:UvrD-helicase domain-containing protein [Leptospira santarosai]|uniref:UvrD-helicase domain-containing protein n=1 Tax=Leptospira santarosai TaxID=28183 RepID=UPI000772F7E6|nr:ATP-dependent helicase [Leptospira santarosai]MDI7237914.1 ATP-dependent helicase [Leptospira santarosai]
MPWNDGLDDNSPAYKLAVSESSTIRSLAGPGSGKSFAIKRRISRMIESGVDPEKILAITFTRTSAADLRREISSLENEGADKVIARTVHSHALSILINSNVLSKTDRLPRMIIDHEIAPALRDINIDDSVKIKERENLKDEYLAAWASLQADTPGYAKSDLQESFETELVSWLKFHEGVLVGEVLPIAVNYLRHNPASTFIGEYLGILADEYQDLNKSEQEFIRLIKGQSSIVIVGDDDQSIYGFKYAHPEGIRELSSLHGEFEDVVFDVCRRCPKTVVKIASSLIHKNKNRTLGDLIPYNKNQDGDVQIIQWRDLKEEIDGLAEIIKNELNKGEIQEGEILVLSPRRHVGYKLRDKLIGLGIKVKSYFREDVISKDHVKRAYSLIHLLANPEDKISLRFLLGYGSNDFRKNQYAKVREKAQELGISILKVLEMVLAEEIKIKGLKGLLNEFRKIKADIIDINEILTSEPEKLFRNYFISKSDELDSDFYELHQIYLTGLLELGTEDAKDSSKSKEWIKKISDYLIESVALPNSPEKIDHVRIMSLHSSKGLSAKFVIITSAIDPLIPYYDRKLSESEQEKAIEESRRLFYVAITRCKSSENAYPGRLIISSFTSLPIVEAARMGINNVQGRPFVQVLASRFLQELGPSAPIPIRGNSAL